MALIWMPYGMVAPLFQYWAGLKIVCKGGKLLNYWVFFPYLNISTCYLQAWQWLVRVWTGVLYTEAWSKMLTILDGLLYKKSTAIFAWASGIICCHQDSNTIASGGPSQASPLNLFLSFFPVPTPCCEAKTAKCPSLVRLVYLGLATKTGDGHLVAVILSMPHPEGSDLSHQKYPRETLHISKGGICWHFVVAASLR